MRNWKLKTKLRVYNVNFYVCLYRGTEGSNEKIIFIHICKLSKIIKKKKRSYEDEKYSFLWVAVSEFFTGKHGVQLNWHSHTRIAMLSPYKIHLTCVVLIFVKHLLLLQSVLHLCLQILIVSVFSIFDASLYYENFGNCWFHAGSPLKGDLHRSLKKLILTFQLRIPTM